MAKIKYEIIECGDAILARKMKPVSISRIKSRSFQLFVDDMISMLKGRGVGIAANQMGKGLRVFVSWVQPTNTRPHLVDEGPTVVINPNIVRSSKKERKWEGCMSLPGVMGMVPRQNEIKVKYLDRNGNKKMEELDGLKAHIFLHEIDHLDGITFTERMLPPVKLITGGEYIKRLNQDKK